MTSQCLNFLWLNLELPARPDPAEGSIYAPMPAGYIGNIRAAAERHPQAQIGLWVDSRRLTEKQLSYLRQAIENERPNVLLKDLRTIPAYDRLPLYNKPEIYSQWRHRAAPIWSQVDAAKVLISLQGNADQTFFADLDHAHLDIDSREVQRRLAQRGIFVGNWRDHYEEGPKTENQLWGFTPAEREFFERYYTLLLQSDGARAWEDLVLMVDRWCAQARVSLEEFLLPIIGDGSKAEQPGSSWQKGCGEETEPSFIRLTGDFNNAGGIEFKKAASFIRAGLKRVTPKPSAAPSLPPR